MIRIILLAMIVIILSGCDRYDNMVYKYGNGIKESIADAASAIACVSVGTIPCVISASVSGYIEGKQEARKAIVAKDDAKLIKKLAEKEARDRGVKVDDCFWLNPFC